MKELIHFATIQFQENDSLDFSKTEKLLNLHNDLYNKIKVEFFKTCSICYEISSYDSFCNCKIKCEVLCNGCEEISAIDTWIDCKNNAFNRKDLMKFIGIYENSKASLTAYKELIELLNNDNLIDEIDEEKNKKTDLNNSAIISVQQFMKEVGFVSIHKTVRKNQGGLPYLTFIKADNVVENIYFSKEAGEDKEAGQLIQRGFFDKLNIAAVTNPDGEVRMKIVDEYFNVGKVNEIAKVDASNEIDTKEVFKRKSESKHIIEEQTVEEKEIRFIKEFFVVILAIGLITFSTITIIIGTFFESNFFRRVLLFFSSDKISLEDKIQNSGFGISMIAIMLMLFLNNIGSKTKIETLKKILDSKRSTQIYILIGLLLFAVVFWKASTILVIGFALVFVLVMLGISINNRV